MKLSWRYYLEQLSHAAITGGFIGLLIGCMEYLFLSRGNAYFDEFTGAYWAITVPYTILGFVGGILAAVAIRCVLGVSMDLSQQIARLWAVLIAFVVLAEVVVWATYRFGTPLLKFSNLVAYLVSVVVTLVIGVVSYRASRAMLSWVESKSKSQYLLRVGVPFVLMVIGVLVLLLPAAHLRRTRSVQVPSLAASTDSSLKQRPHVVFILIDTLRADHLPIYGYSRQTAPNLMAFAQRGVTLTRMYSQASDTRPSVASIFSSLYPSVHKMNHQRDYLAGSIVTLPEALHAAGYKTFGVSANANVSPTFGYAQGFNEFRVTTQESPFRMTMLGTVAQDILSDDLFSLLFGERLEIVPRAEAITDVTLRWLSQAGTGPYFLYVHYIDPHWPYTPPSPYDRAFTYRSNPSVRAGGIDPLKLLPKGKDREQVGRTLDQYDGEILYADYHVGRLLKGLKDMGILDNALVIVTADHGEEFFEHGRVGHSNTLYEEVLRVPFLISWPGQIPAGATYDETVALVDVMPTLLSFLGVDPPTGVQGISFAAHLAQQTEAKPEREHFAQLINDRLSLEMVRHGRYKFIRNVYGPRQGLEELYNLQQDPLEKTNMAPRERAQVAALRQELDTFNKFASQIASLTPEQRVHKLDKDTERALRALGYLK